MDKRSVLRKVILIAAVGWIFGMGIIGFSSGLAEEITLTTYYPSPFGVYEELRANKMVIGDPDSSSTPAPDTEGVVRFKGISSDPGGSNDTEPGALYYNSSDDKFRYHDSSGWKNMGGGGYCYTYYSTSTSSCDCPSGETNKKDLGSWGHCYAYTGHYIFRPPGLSCAEIWPYPYDSVDRGLACVCCED